MPTKKSRKTKIKEYDNNPDFFYFVDREFRSTAEAATIEELAEFAFGSVEEAVEAFKQSKET